MHAKFAKGAEDGIRGRRCGNFSHSRVCETAESKLTQSRVKTLATAESASRSAAKTGRLTRPTDTVGEAGTADSPKADGSPRRPN